MLLDTPNKTVEVVLGAAVAARELDVTFEVTSVTGISQSSAQCTTNGTTPITAVNAPPPGENNKIVGGRIVNCDTATARFIVSIYDGTNRSEQCDIDLAPRSVLQYDGKKWEVVLADGSTKTGVVGPVGPQGPVGSAGASGATGNTGPTGPAASNVVTTLSISSGVVNIDLSLSDLFDLSLTANVSSITFSNPPGSGKGQCIFIRTKQDATGGRTVALPSSWKAVSGSDAAVQSAANAYTLIALTTVDNGTRWEYVMKAGAA